MPALPLAFKDEREQHKVFLPPIRFSKGAWWAPNGYWECAKDKLVSTKGRLRMKKKKGADAPAPNPAPLAPAAAPVAPAPAPKAKAVKASGPLADASALIAASGLNAASERAISQLLSGSEGAVAFAQAVLARLKAKVAKVAVRRAVAA